MTGPSDGLSRRTFLGRAATGAIAMHAAGMGATAAEGSPWAIGCYTRPWDQHDYRVALDAIAEAGYRHVGLMTTKSESGLVISPATSVEEANAIGAECEQRGLAIPSVYGGGIAVDESLEAGIAALRRLIDNCAVAGAKNLMMGGIGAGDLYDRYYDAIAACCPYAAEKGVGISVKPHGGLNATGPQCRALIKRVGQDNFRIWYDPGNIFYYSDGALDPVDDAPAVDGLVVGMCVKDYRHPKEVMLTPGTGQVDFARVIERLKAGGFTGGPLIVECLARGDLAHTLAEAKKARAFVEHLVG